MAIVKKLLTLARFVGGQYTSPHAIALKARRVLDRKQTVTCVNQCLSVQCENM